MKSQAADLDSQVSQAIHRHTTIIVFGGEDNTGQLVAYETVNVCTQTIK